MATRLCWVALALFGVAFVAVPVAQAGLPLTINEIRIDDPGSDDNEYFELAGPPSTSLDNLWYVVIGDGPGGSGSVEYALDLTGQTIGASGYFVAATPTFTLGTPDLTTALVFENSDNVTHLLVVDFTGAVDDDLDIDDDCTLDVLPWAGIVDSVSLIETFDVPASGECFYGANEVGPDGTFVPGHVFRCEDGTGAFQIGEFDDTIGQDTPGAENDCPEAVLINEIRIDQPGSDLEEYFELFGVPGGSLDGLTYVVIGDGATASGTIEEAIDLTGQALDGNGYFVAAEATFTLGTANLTIDLNFENSDNVTHLIVRDFTGVVGADLDVDDDCALDVEPWSEIVDSIALVETFDVPASGECFYGANTVGPDGTFVPGHAFRCGDGGPEFGIGIFDPATPGLDTPGAANPEPLEITNQPNDRIAFEGFATILAVGAQGGGEINYQWRKDGIDLVDGGNISGATTAMLTIDPVMAGDAGSYDCVLTSRCGDATSDAAVVTTRADIPAVTINEIRTDQSGSDNDEYFELAGMPGTSLDGIYYVVIGDGAGGSGVIEMALDLSGFSIPADGYFLAVEDTFTAPCADTPDFIGSSVFGDPTNINFENSDNVTHLLVAGFGGAFPGDDLDAEDDCVLDFEPWVTRIDEIGIKREDFPPGDCLYSASEVGPDGTFAPGHVFRCPDTTGPFVVAEFDLCNPDETPGAVNGPCILTQPSDVEGCEGEPVVFSVVAGGTGTVTFQWQQDGIDLVDTDRFSGTDSDTLTIDPVYVTDAASYTCVVTDENGSLPSAPANLTVEPLYDARVGNVNSTATDPVDVLTINGSSGRKPEREVTISVSANPIRLRIDPPPALSQAKYAIYLWNAVPTKDTRELTPAGDIAMPTPLTGTGPQPVRIANNLNGALGTTNWFTRFSPIEKAPFDLIDLPPNSTGRSGFQIYFQGFIQDPNSPSGQAAVTNGILLELIP